MPLNVSGRLRDAYFRRDLEQSETNPNGERSVYVATRETGPKYVVPLEFKLAGILKGRNLQRRI